MPNENSEVTSETTVTEKESDTSTETFPWGKR